MTGGLEVCPCSTIHLNISSLMMSSVIHAGVMYMYVALFDVVFFSGNFIFDGFVCVHKNAAHIF